MKSLFPQFFLQLLADALWPQLRDLWNRKEAWAGCSELDKDLKTGWDQAKQCLAVLRQLGRNGILTIQQLQNTPDSWSNLSDLRRRHCEISEKEYQTFLEWVRAAGVDSTLLRLYNLRVQLPACIVGSVQSVEPHDQIKLAPPPSSASGATLLQDVFNSTLVAELCRSRAEILIVMDRSTVLLVECLVPLDRLWPRNELSDSKVVQTVPVYNSIHQLAVLNTALIQENLMACGAEKIAEACN